MFGQALAVCAGVCAATASLCAKLAFSADGASSVCLSVLDLVTLTEEGIAAQDICEQIVLPLRGVFFLLVFLLNGFMWTLFVRSLQGCASSIQATVTNTAANFVTSAVIGWLLFNESLSLLWWCGAACIIAGVLLIHHGSPQVDDEAKKNE